MEFELVSEDSVSALEVRVRSIVARVSRLESVLDRARLELVECQRAADAARTAVRGIAKK